MPTRLPNTHPGTVLLITMAWPSSCTRGCDPGRPRGACRGTPDNECQHKIVLQKETYGVNLNQKCRFGLQ